MACKPKILINVKPTNALDVTVRAQLFDPLRNPRRETRTTILLITWEMGEVCELVERVMVLCGRHKVRRVVLTR